MSNLYGTIGTSTPECLLADPIGARPIAVPVEPGNGTLKRGTLLVRKSSGLWAPAATSDVANTNLFAVLNEEIESGASVADNPVAETAAAYETGRFIDGKVLYYKTADTKYDVPTAAMKVVLARQGIFFDPNIRRVIANAAKWAAPRIIREIPCPKVPAQEEIRTVMP